MAKESGLGAGLLVDGHDLSGDTMSLGALNKALDTWACTDITKYAMVRQASHVSAKIDIVTYFNPTGAHTVYAPRARTDHVVTYVHKMNALGSPAFCIVAKQNNYDLTRDNAGNLSCKVAMDSSNYWGDWGQTLTVGTATHAGATNGTGVDFGDPTPLTYSFGLQAFLHVTAFTGTSATVKLQESANNGSPDAWADVAGGMFATITGAGVSERIQTSRVQTVERYLRVVSSGTFTSMTLAVIAAVNVTSMATI